jgi:hypothetical protein
MPFAGGDLCKDIRAAFDWHYGEVRVESKLYSSATADHARHTTEIARAAREAVGP